MGEPQSVLQAMHFLLMRTTGLTYVGKVHQQPLTCRINAAPACRQIQMQRVGYVLWRALVFSKGHLVGGGEWEGNAPLLIKRLSLQLRATLKWTKFITMLVHSGSYILRLSVYVAHLK